MVTKRRNISQQFITLVDVMEEFGARKACLHASVLLYQCIRVVEGYTDTNTHTHTRTHTHTHTHTHTPPHPHTHTHTHTHTNTLGYSLGGVASCLLHSYGVFGLAPRHFTCRNTGRNTCRYTDWRPNLLHGVSTAVFVGSRTVDSLLPPALFWT